MKKMWIAQDNDNRIMTPTAFRLVININKKLLTLKAPNFHYAILSLAPIYLLSYVHY